MSFLFGKSDYEKAQIELNERKLHKISTGRQIIDSEREKEREREIEREKKMREESYKENLKQIKELFPNIDIDFLEEIYNNYPYRDGDNEEGLMEMYNLEKLNYNQFIGFRLACKNRGDYLYLIDKTNPHIFMSNVNIDWKLLQLAKKDKTIYIPPPNPPPLPSPPKRSSPKKSKLTSETLQEAKSKLKPKGPPNPPPLPSPPKRSSPKKSKLTNETLQSAKSKLKPKGPPPNPPPLPSPPKRSSPKKSKLTNKTLQSAKSKLKPKGPPNPPPLPSPPKRSSPKKSKLTNETLQSAKSKLKRYLNPKDPNYELEMEFENLKK